MTYYGALEFRVFGIPGAQGSKVRTQYGMRESSKKVKPWRRDVVNAAKEAMRNQPGFEKYTGPVSISVTFFMQRPKRHYRTGRFAGELRPFAPVYIATKPDGDKLLRSTFDALTTAQVWHDDSLAVKGSFEKKYDSLAGAIIRVHALPVTE